MVFKNIWVLVLWMKVASAFERFPIVDFRIPTEIVIWIYDTFDNNLEIENDFTKYLKESCWKCYDECFSFKCYCQLFFDLKYCRFTKTAMLFFFGRCGHEWVNLSMPENLVNCSQAYNYFGINRKFTIYFKESCIVWFKQRNTSPWTATP